MSHSCDETYDIYDEHELIARKAHVCCACLLRIEPGHKYTRVFVLYDGRKETYKRCIRCQLIHEHLRDLAPGERWPDEELNCGQLYEDEWGTAPEWLRGLAFWRPGEPLPHLNECRPEAEARCRSYYTPWQGRRCAQDGYTTRPSRYLKLCSGDA